MTEEQIKQKAEKHADAYATPDLDDSFRVYIYEANKDGYIAGATEATKELQEQIEKLNKELEEYKNIDKRLICNHKYFTSDIKNNNLAVICHSILSCDMCGRWEEK